VRKTNPEYFMTFTFRAGLMSVLMTAVCGAGFAQSAPATDTTPPAGSEDSAISEADQYLASWLLVHALDRKCQVLGYSDRRALVSEIQFTRQNWMAANPEAAQTEAGQAEIAERYEALALRAIGDAEEISCEDAINYIYQARQHYMRSILRLIIGAAGNSQWDTEPAAIQTAWQALVNEIGSFIGQDEFIELRDQIQGEIAATPDVDKDAVWSQLRPLLVAAYWQMGLNATNYSFFPTNDAPGQFEFVAQDDGAPLPFALSAPAEIQIVSDAQDRTTALSASGLNDDGQVVVFVMKYAEVWPDELESSLLLQSAQSAQATGTPPSVRAFQAEQLPDETCPTDFCFIFPAEADPFQTDANGQRFVSQILFTAPAPVAEAPAAAAE
tara:strand:+ start:17591 stop:18742 length:1152 start_codon:yes stop_codon:yes gene_type:complete